MANEGLGWDSLLKMVHNPGGDWNPGKGDNPNFPATPDNWVDSPIPNVSKIQVTWDFGKKFFPSPKLRSLKHQPARR